MVGEEKRHQMMQNLFGDQSEEEEDEVEEVESEHESNRQPDYASDEGDGGSEHEGHGEVEGHREAEIGSEDENQDLHKLEGEREKVSQHVITNQREESEERYSESDEKQQYGHRHISSRRHAAVESGSRRSGDNHYADEDDEVNQGQSGRSMRDVKDKDQFLQSAPEIRDVFGESDDEEPVQYGRRTLIVDEETQSPFGEEENYVKDLRPEDMVHDEYNQYDSEEERRETKSKDKPLGPPLELEIPLCPPPAQSNKMNMIKVSNIMGVDPKPFNPRDYVEEDFYVTDESGSKKRIRLENNVVRWRKVKKSDGSTEIESNARFVEWSDGSLQLLIGNEVLDISKQDAQNERTHLFLRHGKGILQSQGQILSKMRFMPSSLASNSHRLLTALVDSRHKKVYKVKNCITDIDPEKEKEQQEKAVSQSIKANELLSRKKERVNRKYAQPRRDRRQLSPGFLEDALDEEEDQDYYEPRRSSGRRHFEEDLELEARAEKGSKNVPRKSSLPAAKSSRRPVDFSDSEEEDEYETEEEEEEEGSPVRRDNVGEEFDQREEEDYVESEEEAEEPKHKARTRSSGNSLKRKEIDSDAESPPRKTNTRRRMQMFYDSDDE